MARPHYKSALSINKVPVPIDKSTVLLCHYDISTTDVNGTEPSLDTATLTGMNQSLRKNGTVGYDGKFGGAVLLEEGTTNLLTTSTMVGDVVLYTNVPLLPSTIYTLTDFYGALTSEGVLLTIRDLANTTDLQTIVNWAGIPKKLTFTTGAAISGNYIIKFWLGGATAKMTGHDFQLEQKPFSTFYTPTTRPSSSLTYPIDISGDFTISYRCKFDYKWYNASTGYNKSMLQLVDTEKGMTISLTDYASVLSSNAYFFDLEPDASWDATMHHWHATFNYLTDVWYSINIIKFGNTLSKIIYDDTGTKVTSTINTYTESTKLNDFTFSELKFSSAWSYMLDELRVDNVARTEEEILSWYLSQCPFYAKERYKLVR